MADGRLRVGFVARAHGLAGQVVVELTTNRTERVASGAVLHTLEGRELRVRSATPSGTGRWIVTFAGVGSRVDAEALRGQALVADPLDDPDVLWVHELIGAEVVDPAGTTLGTVEAVQANPASDLLVLDTGTLVPLRFVTGRSPGRVTIDPPAGLLEL
jgi:16S rRNA processing protein RimM